MCVCVCVCFVFVGWRRLCVVVAGAAAARRAGADKCRAQYRREYKQPMDARGARSKGHTSTHVDAGLDALEHDAVVGAAGTVQRALGG